MSLWFPCVRECWSAAVTASHWPYQAARVGPRPGQSDVSLVSSGWTTVRPASARERQKHPLLPLTYLPPSALSLSMLRCLFSGRPGFLCDGALDERRKRGMGQRGKDRHRKRWMVMGWRSCARSDLGKFVFDRWLYCWKVQAAVREFAQHKRGKI